MKISKYLCLLMLFGMTLTGCDKNNGNNNLSEIYSTYQSNGGTLSYDDWLASIQDGKTQKGEPGPQGPAGQDGVSIASILKTGTEGLVDTYTITYSNGTTSTFTVTNGADGQDGAQGTQGIQGNPGADGHTPVILVGTNGNWFVDGVDSGIHAQGPQGETGPQGPQGDVGPQGPQGNQGPKGDNGYTPYIGENGNWWINNEDTGYQAIGHDGTNGVNGQDGTNGTDGVSITGITKIDTTDNVDIYQITFSNDHTFEFSVINGTNGVDGQNGSNGQDGKTPHIGENGNWWIGDEDTGYQAIGHDGTNGVNGHDGANGVSITGISKISSSENVDTYRITFSNGDHFDFVVTNGLNGNQGPQGETGPQGPQGEVGPQGPQGETGPQGPTGNDGVSVVSIIKTGSEGLIDTYTITYSNNTTSTFTVTNGADGQDGAQGPQGIQGNPGADGHTPAISVGTNGNWFVDGEDTGIHAQGPQGETGPQGPAGNDGVSVVSIVKTGSEGLIDTYTITYSNNTTSTFTVTNGADGQDGVQGPQGIQGNPGADGHTPAISVGTNGNWFVDGEDTGIHAQGPQGEQGNPGIDGSTILTGSENPQSSLGKDGDMYLNTSSYDVYEKVDGEWTVTCNIKGLKGDTGVSVVGTEIDENGDLIVTFSNDQVVNAGHVKDVTKYTVSFYCGDDLVATRTVEPNSKISEPSSQETAGYTISSWHVEGYDERPWVFSGYYADRVTEDVKLCADFTANNYKIKFVDSKFGKTLDPLNVTYNSSYNITQYLEEAGYTFCNWNESNGELFPLTGTYRFSKSITLYANWNANTYTVTLVPGYEGGETTTQEVVFDSNYTLPSLYRNHYVFLGWYDGDTRISNNAIWKIDHDITLTGKWNGNANTYVFDAGNGTVDPVTMTIEFGAPYELPIPTSDDSSLSFDYWELDGEPIECSGESWQYESSNRTIVAHYYDISMFRFVKNGDGYGVGHATGSSCIDDLKIPNIYNNLPVTSILDNGFSGCHSLMSIVIPDSLTSIGNHAFDRCSSLTSITIPNLVTTIGNYAFRNCNSLTSITIPNSVTSIGESAFDSCNSLTSITISNSVTSIGNHAFDRCSSLTSITIPNSVTSIGESAFFGCSSLTSITIPNSVTSIGKSAFSDCSSLTSIFVAANNAVYDSRNNCNGIIQKSTNTLIAGCSTTIIPSSVTSIGESAFSFCSSLTSIKIPNSVTSIKRYAFYSCSSLTSIAIPNSVNEIEEFAFSSCSSLTSITISDSVTSIGYASFSDCSSLTSIKIPNSVTSIGNYAFSNCFSLTSITIPNSVTSIGSYAFDDCISLRNIVIPTSIVSMGSYVFYGCSDLLTISCKAKSKPAGWDDAWCEDCNCTIKWGA